MPEDLPSLALAHTASFSCNWLGSLGADSEKAGCVLLLTFLTLLPMESTRYTWCTGSLLQLLGLNIKRKDRNSIWSYTCNALRYIAVMLPCIRRGKKTQHQTKAKLIFAPESGSRWEVSTKLLAEAYTAVSNMFPQKSLSYYYIELRNIFNSLFSKTVS